MTAKKIAKPMADDTEFTVVEGIGNVRKLNNNAIAGMAKHRAVLHAALYCSVFHATRFNDTTLVSELWNGLGQETNKANGVAVWLREYTNLSLRTAKDGSKQWLKPKDVSSVEFEAEAAKATPFYRMPEVEKKNETVPEFDKLFNSMIARFAKLATDGKIEAKVAARVNYVKAAYDKFITEQNATPAIEEGATA